MADKCLLILKAWGHGHVQVLYGEQGDDSLDGGFGVDVLYGGA